MNLENIEAATSISISPGENITVTPLSNSLEDGREVWLTLVNLDTGAFTQWKVTIDINAIDGTIHSDGGGGDWGDE